MSEIVVSKELQDRLDQVETQLREMQGEMLSSAQEAMAYMQRVKLLEETDHRREEDIRELRDATRGMQKQFEQVSNKIDMLDLKIFQWMQQLTKDSSTERQSNQKDWMRFLQIVLGGTIFLIVAYIFSSNFIR